MFLFLTMLVETIPKSDFVEYDGIFKKNFNNTTMVASASSTWLNTPSDVINPDSYYEFCTKYKKEKQWFAVQFTEKSVKLKSYAIQLGCCYFYDSCCCELYSWVLEGSNDNTTWSVLDKEDKLSDFYYCNSRTFELKKASQPYSYFRITQTETKPNCDSCIGMMRMEFFGDLVAKGSYRPEISEDAGDDEEVSIIGHVKHE